MKYFISTILSVLLLTIVACASGPVVIPEDLAPVEFFQKAQEAVSTRDDYETALAYYYAFLERFPEDALRAVEAEYEIAFIHYVRKDYDTAEKEFRALIATYNESGSDVLPKWPKVLAEKLLLEIEILKETAEE